MKWNKIQFGAKLKHEKIWCQKAEEEELYYFLLHSRAEMCTTTE